MWIKDFLWNNAVQWLSFVPAVEWINTVWWALTWLNSAEFWDIFWSVKWAIDGVLDMTWAESLMLANPAVTSVIAAWWAWLLSNKILKDLGLVWEKTLGLKNLTRYALNWAAILWTYSAWTVAAPYLLAWAWAYFIGKHGWKFSKELTKRWLWTAWGLTWWLVKWAATWVWNSTKAWIKWEQKINPVI